MEKKVYELRVDPDLRDLIPPLTDEEHRMLEDSIVRGGCDTPLIVWNGVIVDGHNRYEICCRHSIPFTYEEKPFTDKESAMFWMLEHQLARRNLNSYQRSLLVLRFEPMYAAKAKKRLVTSTGGNAPQPVQNSAQAENGKTRDKLGKIAGVSHDTIAKVKELDAKADDDTKKKLQSGEISIHKAYTEMKDAERSGDTRICERCHEEKPINEFTLPSNRKERLPFCKACEARARELSKPFLSGGTGIITNRGRTGHVSTGIPDDPAMFDQVISLLQHAQNAFLAAFESTVAQYHPSMVTEEHSDLIRQLIDHIADTAENILEKHLTDTNKEENEHES